MKLNPHTNFTIIKYSKNTVTFRMLKYIMLTIFVDLYGAKQSLKKRKKKYL